MIMLSAMMPFDAIVGIIEEATSDYKNVPSEENKHALASACMMLVAKMATDGKDVKTVLKDMKEHDNIISSFENLKTQS